MVLTSFNQDKYEKTIRDESYKEGEKCGKILGHAEERILMKKVYHLQKQGYSVEQISSELNVSLEDVVDILDIE